jgi:hypothetical protein
LLQQEDETSAVSDLDGGVPKPPADSAVIEHVADVFEQVQTLRSIPADPRQGLHGVAVVFRPLIDESVDAVPDEHRQLFRFGGSGKAIEELLLAFLLRTHQEGDRVGGGQRRADLLDSAVHDSLIVACSHPIALVGIA